VISHFNGGATMTDYRPKGKKENASPLSAIVFCALLRIVSPSWGALPTADLSAAGAGRRICPARDVAMHRFLLPAIALLAMTGCSLAPPSPVNPEVPYPPARPAVVGDILHIPTGY
jgi:hypothetical protein